MSLSEDDREHLRKLLPLLAGKVNAVIAKKGQYLPKDLETRTIQVRPST